MLLINVEKLLLPRASLVAQVVTCHTTESKTLAQDKLVIDYLEKLAQSASQLEVLLCIASI